MRIGEFAAHAGVTARVLRHYEDAGLLEPSRTSSGYRDYGPEDLRTVARIRLMIEAGLNAVTIRRYLDCVESGSDGTSVEMCPALRGRLDAVAARLDDDAARIARTRAGIDRLTGADSDRASSTSPAPSSRRLGSRS
ncbi:DNA-binding transcriptional regulator, MerR family [Gordonia malaquae]|uniref:Putative MerR family transcriptional regulator n=1 Tax=Gordonia malaquae NBRC 108250 TaxID=1223542 RepID=M3VBX2_GORML|nr:MerR family transcriptional regulator [Gordonia malaquae]GAC81008.1 putative MerR family transcriptional regulator [Gordonia malaquae NBRC 108250]SEE39554.1 DNA-binding transcriptional regulator, MerR family [Gordonia malaquae]